MRQQHREQNSPAETGEETLPAEPTLEPDPQPLAKAAEALGIQVSADDRWDDIYFRIAFEKIA